MPYRSLKYADLKPLSPSTLRTVPQFALVLTVAAQVIVWGMLIVAAFILLRPFQIGVETYELQLSVPTKMLVDLAEVVREQVWWILLGLFAFVGVEVFFFVRRRPFAVPRLTWLALMLFSLLLPFLLLLVGSMLLLQASTDLLPALR